MNSSIDVALSLPGKHPEMKPGERFVMNMTAAEYRRLKTNKFANVKSWRMGKQAYQATGKKVKASLKYRPVFYTPKMIKHNL